MCLQNLFSLRKLRDSGPALTRVWDILFGSCYRYEQAEFVEREMEHMTEQIKSIIQTLNASQVMVQHSMILVFLLSSFNNYQFMIPLIILGRRIWCIWWDDSVRCGCPNLKQSAQFLNVDWWQGLYSSCLFISFRLIIHLLIARALIPWHLIRQKSSHLVSKSLLPKVLLQIVYWWAQNFGCLDPWIIKSVSKSVCVFFFFFGWALRMGWGEEKTLNSKVNMGGKFSFTGMSVGNTFASVALVDFSLNFTYTLYLNSFFSFLDL